MIRDYWWVHSKILDHTIGAGYEEVQDSTLVVRWGVDVLSETEGSKKLCELLGMDIVRVLQMYIQIPHDYHPRIECGNTFKKEGELTKKHLIQMSRYRSVDGDDCDGPGE